ncbi:DUF2917 domain-containing protein [Phragmitibacter flavus]|uniref:DUF2917 domain-containing protein n=1 Tax=Phragmitibacter flavus TaxID=2576071 RepID=A0A5R8K9G7_9BACT|nr:DUF2917 domain-containing protein [Phragmitibacter flavus]TLD68953.1 DUF2917 domain-containing protein [Phragmitibacter flavus]
MRTTDRLLQLPRLIEQMGAFFAPGIGGQEAVGATGSSRRNRAPRLMEIRLDRGRVWAIDETFAGGELRVIEGVVWVTDSPATGDYVVNEGEVFALVGSGPWVVQALEDAVVGV